MRIDAADAGELISDVQRFVNLNQLTLKRITESGVIVWPTEVSNLVSLRTTVTELRQGSGLRKRPVNYWQSFAMPISRLHPNRSAESKVLCRIFGSRSVDSAARSDINAIEACRSAPARAEETIGKHNSRARVFLAMSKEEQSKLITERQGNRHTELVNLVSAIFGYPHDKGRPRRQALDTNSNHESNA